MCVQYDDCNAYDRRRHSLVCPKRIISMKIVRKAKNTNIN